jgi:hypothetical protein
LRAAALVIETSDPWFGTHAAQLGALAFRHSIPAIYQGTRVENSSPPAVS